MKREKINRSNLLHGLGISSIIAMILGVYLFSLNVSAILNVVAKIFLTNSGVQACCPQPRKPSPPIDGPPPPSPGPKGNG